MNLKINYYLLRLIKNNAIYVIALLFVFTLFIFIAISWGNEYFNYRSKIHVAKAEIEDLSRRKTKLDNLIMYNLPEIKDFNIILSRLVPESEDYFSIVYALDKLSKDTGFILTDYGIVFADSPQNTINLSVNGNGDENTFSKFVDYYNFESGRLITMSDFDFNNKGVQYAFSFNFYNNKIPKEVIDVTSIPEKDLKFMRDLKNKYNLAVDITPTPEVVQEYPTNPNPF